jgi:hypothetical protein
MSSAAVSSSDHWIALAAALQHAKAGNHEHVSRLLARVKRDTAPGLVLAVTALVGDAGSEMDVEGLIDLMDESQPDYTRVVACKAAAHSGYIWLAPGILECWRTITPRERGEIELSLKILLEREVTEITGSFRFEEDIGYFEFVSERISEIFSKYGDKTIWHALPIHARRVVSEMAQILHEESMDVAAELFAPCRHRLEAMTGMDCSSFYDRRTGRLRLLHVAARLQELLASGTLDGLVDGERYFFGHLVPNT